MKDIQFLDDSYAISPQLTPEQMAEAGAMGFSTVICNRPDGEVADQPAIEAMAEAATASGLAFYAIPMSSPACTAEQVDELAAILDQSEGRVLAYCRTGRRSGVIWQALQAARTA